MAENCTYRSSVDKGRRDAHNRNKEDTCGVVVVLIYGPQK
jgi:hypothetical protein